MIFWLEDRWQTVISQRRVLREDGIVKPFFFSSPIGLDGYLTEIEEQPDFHPKIFIIDMILYGINDLSSIGVENSPTTGGTDAGYHFVNRYLRDLKVNIWGDVPVCFLSELDREELLEFTQQMESSKQNKIEIFNKYSEDDLAKFVTWIKKCIGGNDEK